jgi:hypothetical protein
MDKNKSYIKYYLFLLILSCTLLFPINYPIMLNYFRIVDLILLISFFLFLFINPKINLNLLITLIVICLIFIISCLIGFFYNSLELKRVVFLLKYFYIFYIPWLTVSIIDNERKKRIVNKLLFFSYLAICCWVIYYQYFNEYGSYRVSYPFSLDYSISDAHTLSGYMGMFFAFYIYYFKNFFNINKYISNLLIIFFIISILLTGSRTGVLLILLTFLFNIFFKKNKLSYVFYTLLFVFVCAFFIYLIESKAVTRAISISFTDESAFHRFVDLGIALKDSGLSYYFFGLGFFNSKVWFDGFVSILISHGGLSLLFGIFLYYYFILISALKNNNKNARMKLVFIFCIILYLISNLITESVFILRNAFPVLLMLSIFYLNCIKNNYVNKKNKV